jgi:cytochrome b561
MAARYSGTRILLHWLSAAVIIWASVTGFLAAHHPHDAFRRAIDLINPQIATLFMPVFLCRTALFLRSRPWQQARRSAWPARAALAGHAMLYAMIMAVLVSGLLMMPGPWRLLGLLPMPGLPAGNAALPALGHLHRLCCAVLGMLVLGHVAAVALHHRAGDPVLRRMRPRAVARGPQPATG